MMRSPMSDEEEAGASNYRETARKLRRLAGELRFDLCRRNQLLALADGFERLAVRLIKRFETEAAD
ncbi:MAG TPA: hypothetical protein VF007_01400 [Stellaceae bacterium]